VMEVGKKESGPDTDWDMWQQPAKA